MFDSLTMARKLTDVGIERTQAEVLADGMRQAAEHGEHVTLDMLRAEIATLRADLTWRMLAVGGLVIAALRFLS